MIRRLGRYNKQVLYFDGIDDYVSLPDGIIDDLSKNGKLTIEVLFKAKDSGGIIGYQSFTPPYGGADWVPLIYLINGDIRWGFFTNGCYIISGTHVVGKICHVVHVVDMDTKELRGYLNGVLYNKISMSGDYTITMIHNQIGTAYLVGCWGGTGWSYFEGIIYLVRIWNRVLNDEEVRFVYHDALNLAPTRVRDGLVLELIPDTIDFENGVWRDNSGNGNDGTIYGCKLVTV